jgi:hypothetical protein
LRSTEYFSRWIEVKETAADSSAHQPQGVPAAAAAAAVEEEEETAAGTGAVAAAGAAVFRRWTAEAAEASDRSET